ncbi:hypothetical protein GCM10009674_12980 [Nesterenkonia xinjiangensis]
MLQEELAGVATLVPVVTSPVAAIVAAVVLAGGVTAAVAVVLAGGVADGRRRDPSPED